MQIVLQFCTKLYKFRTLCRPHPHIKGIPLRFGLHYVTTPCSAWRYAYKYFELTFSRADSGKSTPSIYCLSCTSPLPQNAALRVHVVSLTLPASPALSNPHSRQSSPRVVHSVGVRTCSTYCSTHPHCRFAFTFTRRVI